MIVTKWDMDFDFDMFRSVADALDLHLTKVRTWRDEATEETWDELVELDIDNTIGLGFAAAQTYMVGVCRWLDMIKPAAILHGPTIGRETVAGVVNAAANLWKHRDEWDPDISDRHRDRTLKVLASVGIAADTEFPLEQALTGLGLKTIANIGKALVPWRDELLVIDKARHKSQET